MTPVKCPIEGAWVLDPSPYGKGKLIFEGKVFTQVFDDGNMVKSVQGTYVTENGTFGDGLPCTWIYLKYDDPRQLGGTKADFAAPWHKAFVFLNLQGKQTITDIMQMSYYRQGHEPNR